MWTRNNILKWIAIVTMLIDHMGLYLFPAFIIFRIIGRMALPLFIYTTVSGVRHTRNAQQYASRMLIMGVVSILAWGRLFPLNMGFSLAVIILGLTAYKEQKYGRFIGFGLLSIIMEYSIYGYGLAVLFYLWQEKRWSTKKVAGVYGLVHVLVYLINPIQSYALLAIGAWCVAEIGATRAWKVPSIPKAVGYSFYPLHVLILRIMSGI